MLDAHFVLRLNQFGQALAMLAFAHHSHQHAGLIAARCYGRSRRAIGFTDKKAATRTGIRWAALLAVDVCGDR